MSHPRFLPHLFLAAALGLGTLACEPGDSAARESHEHHEGDGHDHGDGASTDVHGQDERGFVILDPQHAAHPNWADVGDLELGDVATATVKLKNVEKTPITIQSVLSGCSCTVPSLSYVTESGERVEGDPTSTTEALVVPPGAVVELALRVDSQLSPARNKDKLVVVRMNTDSDFDPYVTIELRMKVVAAFQSVPPELDLRRIPRNGGGAGTLQIGAIGDSGRGLVRILDLPPGFDAALVEDPPMGNTPVWTLRVRVEPPLALGPGEKKIALATTGPGRDGEGRPYEVKVRWTAVEDVEIAPARMLFLRDGTLGREVAQTELFARLPGHLLAITSATIEGTGTDGLIVQLEPAPPVTDGRANRWRITVDPGAARQLGTVQGTIVLTTDDPAFPRFEIPIARK
ncbi:MAG: DUF1573 domain-containing protein [Planctomycetaceae bacterium]|nr:DUF1573 domain-containing protein [Planctomycetaceae bacterium]